MELARAIDFLLWQGHGDRVWSYTLRQLNLFVGLAQERMKMMQGGEEAGRR